LLIEHGYPVDYCLILRIGRNPEEGFEVKEVVGEDIHREMFKACRVLYNGEKALKKLEKSEEK
jgi:hypothetical protein